jgi:hypothetical protein
MGHYSLKCTQVTQQVVRDELLTPFLKGFGEQDLPCKVDLYYRYVAHLFFIDYFSYFPGLAYYKK